MEFKKLMSKKVLKNISGNSVDNIIVKLGFIKIDVKRVLSFEVKFVINKAKKR